MAQILILVVLVLVDFTARFNVAIESQPAELTSVTVYDPATVIYIFFVVWPFDHK